MIRGWHEVKSLGMLFELPQDNVSEILREVEAVCNLYAAYVEPSNRRKEASRQMRNGKVAYIWLQFPQITIVLGFVCSVGMKHG
jgi:hypothetical protein